ncbi:hypothetical protein EVAR_95399_1 [Eumeta japonica]|uniref:Uncharacterized protein n=1 Tax=Eumeta variegata TaxID=151549 RepID=A0A4C1VIT2_EUMVA|nr:hypothetical protein EVAR_95399_1 [Eumeta japonica]
MRNHTHCAFEPRVQNVFKGHSKQSLPGLIPSSEINEPVFLDFESDLDTATWNDFPIGGLRICGYDTLCTITYKKIDHNLGHGEPGCAIRLRVGQFFVLTNMALLKTYKTYIIPVKLNHMWKEEGRRTQGQGYLLTDIREWRAVGVTAARTRRGLVHARSPPPTDSGLNQRIGASMWNILQLSNL